MDLADRKDSFRRRVIRIKEDIAGRGLIGSSIAYQALVDEVRDELRIRAMMAWEVLARVLSSAPLPVDPALTDSVKQILRESWSSNIDDVTAAFEDAATFGRGHAGLPSIEDYKSQALGRALSEVDLALMRSAALPAGTTVNIYQPIGIVQTGSGASASMALSIGEVERHRIKEALGAIREELVMDDLASDQPKGEALELISDIEAELARPEPNHGRVQGALSGLASTIQTLGSASAAYQLLKGAAALVGVTLP